MIRICVDLRVSHIQGIASVPALKEVFFPGGRKKEACFSCGKSDILLRSVRISPNYS
jgi:hypothetical protein